MTRHRRAFVPLLVALVALAWALLWAWARSPWKLLSADQVRCCSTRKSSASWGRLARSRVLARR